VHSFQAILNKPEKVGALSFVTIPFNASQEFQKKGRIKVKGKVNNCVFRTNLIPKGNGVYILVLDKELRNLAGVNYGDMLFVEIELDEVSNLVSIGASKNLKVSSMDVITAITTRRSIREFTDQDIDDDTIQTIVNAGFCAPSAKNKRPWHFIVIRDKKTLFDLSNNSLDHQVIQGSACCVIICGDKVIQGMNEFLIEDCSASIQNMLLTIHGLGLGGVWCGICSGSKESKHINEVIELPVKIIPIGMIAIGYPAEQNENYDRFDKSKVHYEKW